LAFCLDTCIGTVYTLGVPKISPYTVPVRVYTELKVFEYYLINVSSIAHK